MSKFWGLTVSAGKKFKQHVPEAFCVSGAAVEPVGEDGDPVQLYMQQDDKDYLLCSLSPSNPPFQTILNVRIGSGETVGFHLKSGSAKSKVHLTGFTLPPGTVSASTPTNPPFKGQQKSILVTHPKSDDKQKKRVSIVETEPYGEREMESDSDDSDNLAEIRKQLFNGDSLQEESDDDDDDDDDDEEEEEDDDDNSESDLNEEEMDELAQLKLKGKYNPATGGKMDEGEDSDLELLDDDSDEDDSDDEEEQKAPKATVNNREQNQLKQNEKGKKANNSTPQKQSKKNGGDSAAGTPTLKTPENQALKLKTPSSAGHTPMQAALKTFTKGGVLVNELKPGNGQTAKLGKMVTVYYAGRLKSNNKQFDATQNGPGFRFRLGKGEVIKGWDLGVEGMKIGGKRRLTIPAQMAYGKKGAPPDIPPNSTLVFDVELRNVS